MNLSIIIPHLNEPTRLYDTIDDIYAKAAEPGSIEVIVVDDDSDADGYPDIKRLRHQNNQLLTNRCRVGPAVSRHTGILAAFNDRVVMMDAHMRLTPGWDEILKLYIKGVSTHSIISARYTTIGSSSGTVTNESCGSLLRWLYRCGSSIQLMNCDPIPASGATTGTRQIMIPIGAFYCFNRQRYFQIGAGLDRLAGYGMEEPMLAMKYWLTGGECIMINYPAFACHLDIVPSEGRTPRWKLLACKLTAMRSIMSRPEYARLALAVSNDRDFQRASASVKEADFQQSDGLMLANQSAVTIEQICEKFGVETPIESLAASGLL